MVNIFVFNNLDEATAYMEEWQKILRLQNWDIVLRIARREDMGLNEVGGSCSWTLSRSEAIIKLLDPIDYSSDIVFPQDHEVTLVHELLHLHYAPFSDAFTRDSLEYIALEKSIDVIAKTLVFLKRMSGEVYATSNRMSEEKAQSLRDKYSASRTEI